MYSYTSPLVLEDMERKEFLGGIKEQLNYRFLEDQSKLFQAGSYLWGRD